MSGLLYVNSCVMRCMYGRSILGVYMYSRMTRSIYGEIYWFLLNVSLYVDSCMGERNKTSVWPGDVWGNIGENVYMWSRHP